MLDRKVVLVTGGSRGIGKSTVIEFAKKGYDVVINYVNSEKDALELSEFINKEYNVNSITCKADVSLEDDVKKIIYVYKEAVIQKRKMENGVFSFAIMD